MIKTSSKVKKMLRENCDIRIAVDITKKMNNQLEFFKSKVGVKKNSEALRLLLKERLDKEVGVDLNGH